MSAITSITYSELQLNEAIDYIAKNNPYFKGQHNNIRQTILASIKKLAEDPDGIYSGTMGFMLICDRELESIESDENKCHIEIYVEPDLHHNNDENHIIKKYLKDF